MFLFWFFKAPRHLYWLSKLGFTLFRATSTPQVLILTPLVLMMTLLPWMLGSSSRTGDREELDRVTTHSGDRAGDGASPSAGSFHYGAHVSGAQFYNAPGASPREGAR